MRPAVAWLCRQNCKQEVKLIPRGVNLSSFREIRAFVTELRQKWKPVHYLVLNAAIQGAPLWCARCGCVQTLQPLARPVWPGVLRLLCCGHLPGIHVHVNECLTESRARSRAAFCAGCRASRVTDISACRRSREGFESHYAVNYLGQVHLCQLLLEKMLASVRPS